MSDESEAIVAGFATQEDGGRLAYEVHGASNTGVPIVLLRPLGGSMTLWRTFRAILAERSRVIAFDFRGTGRSSPEPLRVSTKSLALEGRSVLDHLGVARAHVFGISLGGMTATWLAIRDPSRVAKLCIASAPKAGVELTHAGIRRGLGMAACFARPVDEVEVSLVDRVLSHEFRQAHPEELRAIEGLVRAHPATRTALLKHGAAGALHDARRHLDAIRAETLVLAGEHDRLLGTEAPRALAAAIRGGTFEVVEQAGHDLTLEQPRVTAQRVARFFAG